MVKKNKNKTIKKDYEAMLDAVLKRKGNVISNQNMKDVIKILLRLASDPTRRKLKKETKDKDIKQPEIHHHSGNADIPKGKYISDLADRLINGEISPEEAIDECINSMRAIPKEEHDAIHNS